MTNVACQKSTTGCWLCGSQICVEFAPSRLPADLTPDLVKITDKCYGLTGRLLECKKCGFIFADTESVRAIEPLYAGLVDPDYQESTASRRRAFSRIVARLRSLRPQARTLLDIGAGVGTLCMEANNAGFLTEGIEPSTWAVAEASKNGIKLHEGYFPHPAVAEKKFDVVTVLDVIEHVSYPVELLKSCRKCLEQGGLLVVVTPDVRSVVARVLGRRWWHFRFAHIGYFSRGTMRAALGAAGFTVERVQPYTWRFTAPYIMERLEQYLPVGALNRLIARTFPRRLGRLEFPLCLFDSYVYYARAL